MSRVPLPAGLHAVWDRSHFYAYNDSHLYVHRRLSCFRLPGYVSGMTGGA